MKSRYVTREIELELAAAALQFPAIVVTGARQTGKSTLLQHTFPDATYVTLDDPLVRRAAREDPRTFLARAPQLIIDEIQQLPELLPYIKIAVDEDRRANGRFLLTGSQAFSLMAGLGESLAGRIAVYRLHPFSSSELDRPMGTPSACFRCIFDGFYPEIAAHGVDRNRFFASYVQTYLERDIRLLTAVQDLHLFQTVVELLAARVGALLNLNEIAKEAGVSFATVRRWLSLLECTGLVFLLRPYSRNVSRRVVKTPKLYFADTGLAAWLLRYPDAQALLHGPQSGAFFENLVVLECFKHRDNFARNAELFFYRDSNRNEIDLLIDAGPASTLVEIKQTATPRAEHFGTLARLLPLFPGSRGYVASLSQQIEPFSSALSGIPWHSLPSRIW
jgi:uncharacterized protein